MEELTVGIVYGTSLYEVAKEENKEDLILEEGYQVLEIMKQEPDLFAFLNDPIIADDEKKQVLKNVFQGRLSSELLNLLCVLVDKSRTRHFPKIMKEYKELVNREDGFAYGKIYSVEPLKPDQLERFEKQTSNLLKENIKLENETDKSLIGGVKILVQGKMIDASLKKRLEDLSGSII